MIYQAGTFECLLFLFNIFVWYTNSRELIRKFVFAFPAAARWVISIIYLAGIAYASLSPSRKIPKFFVFPHIDKVVHFLMYFAFCILGNWAIDKRILLDGRLQGYRKPLRDYLIIFILAVFWGFSMELFQRSMNLGREYSLNDMIANITGSLGGAGIYYLLFEDKPL